MNYLAHVLLSGTDMRVAVGNFIGDGVKGRIPEEYPREIYAGLHLHRFIDYMADTHPVNRKARAELYPVFGKYAGVAQDMIHDHFLASHWDEFCDVSIHHFLELFYHTAEEHIAFFPSHQRRFLLAAKKGDWLINYRDLDGMDRAFTGLSKRILRENPLAHGGAYLAANQESLKAGFLAFFPLLMAESAKELERLLTQVDKS